MNRQKINTTADILSILSDGKVHTMKDIAEEIEVHINTVRNHISSLAYRYPIQTFCGGANKGGVYLEKDYLCQGAALTNDELQLINNALRLLQKSEAGVDNALLNNLLNRFSPPKVKEQINER